MIVQDKKGSIDYMKKVSVIIPVYNSEKYLEQCLKSAMAQTMKDIEIICVNDGSTDNSRYILEKMAAEDSRIIIIEKANKGYGSAMNTGINFATGKYLVFLESDDFILPDMCEEMFKLCEKHSLEIIKTDYYEFKMRGEKVCYRYRKTSNYNNYRKILTPKINNELFFASMYTWTCMYSREFIDNHKIRHNETPGASYQDNGFWFQSLMYCERLYLLDRGFYMYRQDNPNSSIHSKGKVQVFSSEYAFIREKIYEYEGDKENILLACSYFNIHHNMISLKRVDKNYTGELIHLISKDIEIYKKLKVWDIKYLDFLDFRFIKKMFVCLLQPEALKESVWRYIDKATEREKILEEFDTYILYGAGVYARRALSLLEECKMWNKEILCGVTTLKKNVDKINGIEVREMKDILRYNKKALVILCAKKGSDHYIQMRNNLEMWGVNNIIHTNDLIVKDFWDEFFT